MNKYRHRYTEFITHAKRVWVNVLLHREVRRLLEVQCNEPLYRDRIVVESTSPVGLKEQEDKPINQPIKLKGQDLLNFVNSSKGAGSEWMLEWSLVSAIGLFEAFVSDIAKMAYLDYPAVFLVSREKGATEQENYKVVEMLINSQTREEALEKYVEEKLRGIFYGKPINAFVSENGKDGKLRLGTASMAGTCKVELGEYMEITGRRNLVTHNMGKVDAKYLRETKQLEIKNKLSQGNKVKISEDYLFNALKALDKLAREYTELVSQRVEKEQKKQDDL